VEEIRVEEIRSHVINTVLGKWDSSFAVHMSRLIETEKAMNIQDDKAHGICWTCPWKEVQREWTSRCSYTRVDEDFISYCF
jgi:hypothetical protein